MLKKIPYQRAQDIFPLYAPNEAFLKLATKEISPLALIESAMAQALYSDTIIFLAHALPLREGIWWAACCASARSDWNEQEADAIRAAKAWVHTPDENTRIHAGKMADIAGLKTGAGWAAQAAFWSGGSMIRPEDPVVAPPPYLYAQGVAGSVNLTAVLPDGQNATEQYEQFVKIALHLAQGGNGQIEEK